MQSFRSQGNKVPCHVSILESLHYQISEKWVFMVDPALAQISFFVLIYFFLCKNLFPGLAQKIFWTSTEYVPENFSFSPLANLH